MRAQKAISMNNGVTRAHTRWRVWMVCGWLLIKTPIAWGADPLDDVLVWQHRPLALTLPVAQERILQFDEPVIFNSPQPNAALTDDHLHVINLDRHLYVRALQPFDTMRVQVTLHTSGQVVLLDLRGQSDAPDHALRIQTPMTSTPAGHALPQTRDHWVRLLRYALHQVYAPLAHVISDPDLVRLALRTTRPLPALTTPSLQWVARAQWQSMRWPLHVSVVEVRNTQPHSQLLDVRSWCGDWLAASVFPRTQLGAKGQVDATTMVFLLSEAPFHQAIAGCHER